MNFWLTLNPYSAHQKASLSPLHFSGAFFFSFLQVSPLTSIRIRNSSPSNGANRAIFFSPNQNESAKEM